MSRTTSLKQTLPSKKAILLRRRDSSWSKSEWEAYRLSIESILDTTFRLAEKQGWSWKDLATHSGVSYSCIYALGIYKTRYPRFDTVYKVCKAVSLHITITSKVR